MARRGDPMAKSAMSWLADILASKQREIASLRAVPREGSGRCGHRPLDVVAALRVSLLSMLWTFVSSVAAVIIGVRVKRDASMAKAIASDPQASIGLVSSGGLNGAGGL